MNIREYISSGIIESVVLGLASPAETDELMRLRRQYPELDKAVADFEHSLEQQGLSGTVTPPAQVRQDLFSKLEPEFKDPPVIEMPGDSEIEKIPGRLVIPAFWKYVAAAGLILFFGNIIGSLVLYTKYQELNNAYAQLQGNFLDLQQKSNADKERFITLYRDVHMMQDSSMAVVKMMGISGKESSMATVYWDKKTKDVYLFNNNLPPVENGKQYQLWAIVDGKPVDAGMIGDCEGLCKLKNIPTAQAFAVTLENAGGSPTPTMTAMYVMGKV
jgi:hypothetical protein